MKCLTGQAGSRWAWHQCWCCRRCSVRVGVRNLRSVVLAIGMMRTSFRMVVCRSRLCLSWCAVCAVPDDCILACVISGGCFCDVWLFVFATFTLWCGQYVHQCAFCASWRACQCMNPHWHIMPIKQPCMCPSDMVNACVQMRSSSLIVFRCWCLSRIKSSM